MSLVLDASVTLAWLYSHERTKAVEDVFDLITSSGAFVPSLWRLEVANSLTIAVRHSRITAATRDSSLADLGSLQILIDDDTDTYAWSTTLRLADRLRLTLYDAAYLELAQRRDLPLATLDKDLRRAAGKLGVTLLGH